MPPADNDAMATEMRVRRALGLSTATVQSTTYQLPTSRPRHRFVQDGEVPTVVIHSDGERKSPSVLKGRIAELKAILESEQAAHVTEIRSLEELRHTVQVLQTRLIHAEVGFDETLSAERKSRTDAEAGLAEALARISDFKRASGPKSEVGNNGDPTHCSRPPAVRKPKPTTFRPASGSKPVKWWLG